MIPMKKVSDEEVIKASRIARCGAEAARILGVNYKTYRSRAKKNGCFKKDQGISCRGKKSSRFLKGMNDFLNGKYKNKRISGDVIISYLTYSGLREYKCEECGISEWRGRKIVLHVHHKDGNHFHNVPDNISILCPNCHSQTDTFGSKNRNRYNKERDQVISERKEKLPDKVPVRCPECGVVRVITRCATNGKTLCRKCSAKHRVLTTKPSRETLQEEVGKFSYLELGRKYKTSNTTIKRWCKSYGIVLEKRGTRDFR